MYPYTAVNRRGRARTGSFITLLTVPRMDSPMSPCLMGAGSGTSKPCGEEKGNLLLATNKLLATRYASSLMRIGHLSYQIVLDRVHRASPREWQWFTIVLNMPLYPDVEGRGRGGRRGRRSCVDDEGEGWREGGCYAKEVGTEGGFTGEGRGVLRVFVLFDGLVRLVLSAEPKRQRSYSDSGATMTNNLLLFASLLLSCPPPSPPLPHNRLRTNQPPDPCPSRSKRRSSS